MAGRYLLNLIYLIVLLLAFPLLLYKLVRQGKYREGYAQKFFGLVPLRVARQSKCIWLHAVSVGEVNVLEPLLDRIRRKMPDVQCVISTTTRTGMEVARKKYGKRHTIFYCPLDFSWAVSTAMRRVRPDVLVLAELELWPNMVWAAKRHGAKIAVVNGRLSENSFRGYRRIAFFARRILQKLDLIAVQDQSYADRFLQLGARPETVQVTGSMKFDGAEMNPENPKTRGLASLANITEEDLIFLAGSTQQPEEEIVLRVFERVKRDHPALRLIVVPRHPERFDSVAKTLAASELSLLRRTELDDFAPSDSRRSDILLVDAVGELGAWWGTAQIAFVGGSLGNRGGQNMIEPAAYGCAVSFGPNTRNFRDIVTMLLAHQGAVVVSGEEELETFVHRCLEDGEFAQALGTQAREMVESQQGAARKTAQLLCDLVGESIASCEESTTDGSSTEDTDRKRASI